MPFRLTYRSLLYKILRMKVFGMEYSHLASAHPYASSFEQIPNPFRLSTLILDIRRSTSSLRRITLLPYSLITLLPYHLVALFPYHLIPLSPCPTPPIHRPRSLVHCPNCSSKQMPLKTPPFILLHIKVALHGERICSSFVPQKQIPFHLQKFFTHAWRKKHPEGVEPSGRGT